MDQFSLYFSSCFYLVSRQQETVFHTDFCGTLNRLSKLSHDANDALRITSNIGISPDFAPESNSGSELARCSPKGKRIPAIAPRRPQPSVKI